MSLQLFAEDVVFLQRFLKCSGLYGGKLDGIWGPRTDAAVDAFGNETDVVASRLGTFDRTTERHIRTLQPKAQEQARRFMAAVLAAGIPARLISGTRTYAQQDALYHKGRFGNPPPIITKARGGQSNHNFGLAWDIGIFRGGSYLQETPLYRKAAEVGLTQELEWGGHWKSLRDLPHYQIRTGNTIAMVRNRFERGMTYV
jgi:peptidoglycan LD-endopeptidase CwlK